VGHGLDAVDGGDGTDEDSAGLAGEMGGCVEAVVHAVDEVDVGAAGWAEEREVVGGEATVGVRGGVGEAEVGFDFGDATGEALAVEIADEELAEEGSGDDFGGAGVEGSWEELRGLVGLWRWAHIFCGDFLYLHPTSHPSAKTRTDGAPNILSRKRRFLRVGHPPIK
jgi:hypothetical protein